MTRKQATFAVILLALAAAGLRTLDVARAQEAAKAPEAPKTSAAPENSPGAQEAPKTPDPSKEEPPATFPAQVEQVIVDVVVTDKKGNPITGITKESLQISEDGAPQSIVSFDAIEVPAAPAAIPAPRPRISTNTLKEERRGRTFVIVFDDIHLSPFMAQRAKGAVADFLKNGVREGDRVTLVATGGSAWWSTRMEAGRDELIELTKRLDGRYIPDTSPERMSDYEAMRIHQFRDPMVTGRVQRRYETYGVSAALQQQQSQSQIQTVDDPFVTGRAADVYFQATSRNRITLDVLQRSLNSLVNTKGRKSLIIVSEGFIYDPNLDEYKKVIEASRRANTAIYFVNSRGLEGMPVYMTAQFGPALPDQDVGAAFNETYEATEGADSLSADSGGFTVRNTNDLSSGFKRIADETRIYYLVGYNPTNTARDGKFRKIQVKVIGQKGVQVRARKGYYAPSDRPIAPSAKPGVDPVIQTALDSPYEVEDIPLRMTDYVGEETLLGKAQVLVNTEVDVRNLTFEEKDGRAVGSVEFLLVVAHRESGEYFRYDQSMDLKLLPATRERLARAWLPITRDFELRPGGYQAKIVVRDKASGRVGTVIHEFDVPDLTEFRVSTPLISDTREAPAGGGPGGRLAVVARRDFPQGASLFCQLEVYGAQKDQKSGMPRVSMGYQVRRSDGSRWSGTNPSVINPTSLGKLSRMVGFSLEDAAPGDYEMVMVLKDELSGKTLQLKEPFTVTARLAQDVPAPPPGQ
jgi:VWFA-related protein